MHAFYKPLDKPLDKSVKKRVSDGKLSEFQFTENTQRKYLTCNIQFYKPLGIPKVVKNSVSDGTYI